MVIPLTSANIRQQSRWSYQQLPWSYYTGSAAHRIPEHDDIIKWKHFPRYWPFVQGIHRSPVNSPHKGQWRRALMFSLIYAWQNGWVNNQDTGVLRCHCAHCDITVMVRYGANFVVDTSNTENGDFWWRQLCHHWPHQSLSLWQLLVQPVMTMWALSRIILCMCPTNDRRNYNVMSFLIGWAHSQNDPYIMVIFNFQHWSIIFW